MSLSRTIFVDESMFRWPGLTQKEVNIAYGAVSIPDRALTACKKRWKSYEYLLRDLLRKDTGGEIPPEKEIKSTDLGLKPESLIEIGKFWAAFYRKEHVRVFGLFAVAEGIGNNGIRNDAFDASPEEFGEIKGNHEALYSEWLNSFAENRRKMKAAGMGDLGSLQQLIEPLVSCIFHNHFELTPRAPFKIIWDHRDGEEDGLKAIVWKIVHRIRKGMGITEMDLPRFFHGITTLNSEDEVGLRFADFIAGTYRNMFRTYPELLTDNTAFGVLSAKSNSAMLSPLLPYYPKPMSGDLAESLFSNERRIVFPCLIPSLARGLFTYFTKNGDARHCSPTEKRYYDMAD